MPKEDMKAKMARLRAMKGKKHPMSDKETKKEAMMKNEEADKKPSDMRKKIIDRIGQKAKTA